MKISISQFSKRLLFFILSGFLLSACSMLPDSLLPDHKIQLNIKSSANLNPDLADVPSPLTLKVYELSSSDVFEKVDFVPLFKTPKEILGDEMLGPEQIIQIKPNYKMSAKFTVKRNTKYLGVVAAYQNIQAAEWRLIIPLDKNWGVESKWIQLNKLSITE